MPQYCQQSDKKAVVTLYKDNNPFQVTIDNPPITVKCLENNKDNCALVNVVTSAQVHNIYNDSYRDVEADNHCFAPVLGVRVSNIQTNVQIKCRGNISYNGIDQCQGLDWYGALPAFGGANNYDRVVSAAIKSITPITPALNESKKVGVQILDKDGNIKYSNPNIDCIWNVQCGDECPPGTEKYPSSKYPGYCCLDCAGIAREIQEITALARSKNNG